MAHFVTNRCHTPNLLVRAGLADGRCLWGHGLDPRSQNQDLTTRAIGLSSVAAVM
jgi:hypothetical protein